MNKKNIRIVTSLISVLICSLFLIPSYAFTDSSADSLEINNINRELWWWSDLELITEDSTLSSLRVSIDLDSDDNIHASWSDNTDYDSCGADTDIFYRKWSKETEVWSTVEVVTTESTGYSDNSVIVVDRFGNLHVVWLDETALDEPGIDYDIFYKMKDASTGTWTTTEIVSSSSLDYSHFPDIAVDSSGNAHVVWSDYHDYDGTDIDVIYKVRDLTSETWSAVTVISSESTDVSQNPKIAVDSNDFVHVIWQDYTSNLYDSGADRDIIYKMWDPVNLWSEGLALSYESDSNSYDPFIEVDITNSFKPKPLLVTLFSRVERSVTSYSFPSSSSEINLFLLFVIFITLKLFFSICSLSSSMNLVT